MFLEFLRSSLGSSRGSSPWTPPGPPPPSLTLDEERVVIVEPRPLHALVVRVLEAVAVRVDVLPNLQQSSRANCVTGPASGHGNQGQVEFASGLTCCRQQLQLPAGQRNKGVRGKSHKRVPADSDHFLCLTDPSQLVVSLPCVQK